MRQLRRINEPTLDYGISSTAAATPSPLLICRRPCVRLSSSKVVDLLVHVQPAVNVEVAGFRVAMQACNPVFVREGDAAAVSCIRFGSDCLTAPSQQATDC